MTPWYRDLIASQLHATRGEVFDKTAEEGSDIFGSVQIIK